MRQMKRKQALVQGPDRRKRPRSLSPAQSTSSTTMGCDPDQFADYICSSALVSSYALVFGPTCGTTLAADSTMVSGSTCGTTLASSSALVSVSTCGTTLAANSAVVSGFA
ncbi:uncharacterized protein LOC132842658 isoform X2 [Tachysurus vachellii]|uniref:uncharacterized protein LOC132842658 isoform X2 n=1 Tax=Tachysurus vachellii TaxID=175792 RepID=UPI00296AEACE|nr:uncharacterized protein LOC132842658 isoform X2 [Tachysurus vachellii]XP_060721434.1 uncharacterized protein LOC132842658 isoform X2 [Tachysurus vachellii]